MTSTAPRHLHIRRICFQEPRGLFEIATPSPDFSIDEEPEALGEVLQLPLQHESLRAQLETALVSLENPRARGAVP
jgi:glyoxalase family protein